jgi:futalosine hydrolase
MRILIVAATSLEVAPLLRTLHGRCTAGERLETFECAGHDVDVLTTGVGMVATASWCARTLSLGRYDLALNLGVCGAFDNRLTPGTVVHVVEDRLPELGAEDGEAFLTLSDLQLLGDDEFPFEGGRLVNRAPPANPTLGGLPAVGGITVNTVHGNHRSIASVVGRFAPHVETMEGAAFMYSCLTVGQVFAQVRAISNLVERRDRASWRMEEAIRSLNESARAIIDTL